ncbi:MAG: hypothetical protein A2138_25445 [Deltaproteobacteria bacterium RBG_16_71_12]|nr:MAG: hypothetical protein A2138_25445 [Deltaproteobacteria bacterium RBG_16_71_12]
MLLYVGVPVLLFGLLMMARGWIYTFRPEGKMAQRRKRRNLKVGFTTDMALFGRKVRRLGLLIALAGGAMVGWTVSERVDAVAPSASVDAGVTP